VYAAASLLTSRGHVKIAGCVGQSLGVMAMGSWVLLGVPGSAWQVVAVHDAVPFLGSLLAVMHGNVA
jgi:hypothetical protein